MSRLSVRRGWGGLALVSVLAGCGGGPTDPEVVFQVIEETTFAASLNIDLATMEQMTNGVYRLDTVEGVGAMLEIGMFATVTFTGLLSDGTQFDTGQFSFLTGNNGAIQGFETGILGMNIGGSRRLIIPPALGYGSQQRGAIPPGSILIFDVTLDDAG